MTHQAKITMRNYSNTVQKIQNKGIVLFLFVLCLGLPPAAFADVESEFNKLELQMTGMATFMGESSVFIKHPGWSHQMIYGVGQDVAGFKIVAIDRAGTTFERDGVRVRLNRSDSAENLKMAGDHKIDVKEAREEIKVEPQPRRDVLAELGVSRSLASRTSGSNVKRANPDLKVRPNRVTINGHSITNAPSGRFSHPMPGARFGSPFGYRKRPMGGGSRYHRGVDLQKPHGTPILSAGDGVIAEAGRDWAKGNYVIVEHSGGYTTHYFHMSKRAVSKGQRVSRGKVIGYEGSTGISTGPHLHFEIRKNDQAVDPALFIDF